MVVGCLEEEEENLKGDRVKLPTVISVSFQPVGAGSDGLRPILPEPVRRKQHSVSKETACQKKRSLLGVVNMDR